MAEDNLSGDAQSNAGAVRLGHEEGAADEIGIGQTDARAVVLYDHSRAPPSRASPLRLN